MKKPVIHKYGGWRFTACGRGGAWAKATTAWTKVTCRRCLKTRKAKR